MSNESNHSSVTDTFIKAIESGKFFEYERPWIPTASLPLNYNNKFYSPMNSFLLGESTRENGWEGRNWLTKNRIQMLKGYINTDEQKPTSVFSNTMQWVTPNNKFYKGRQISKEDKKVFLFVQTLLYNVSQVEWGANFPKEYDHLPPERNETIKTSQEFRLAHGYVDPYLGKHKIPIEYGDHGAFYSPAHDRIGMPKIESFKNEIGYANTLIHEVIHSTGHKTRLNRKLEQEEEVSKGLERYSLEELVAELASAMAMAKLDIKAAEHNEDSIAYFKGWLKIFKENKRIIPIADAQAKKALAMIDKENTAEELKHIADPVDKMKTIISKAFNKHGSRLNRRK